MAKQNKLVEKDTERDKFEISNGNRLVLETIPQIMENKKWRTELRKLVLNFKQEQILKHHAERGFL